jgi:hypothetical protein
MKTTHRIPSQWALRLGCAFVNFYAGYYLLTDPGRYHKFVPSWWTAIANSLASVDAYLRVQGIGERLIASVLCGWFFPKWAVRAAAITLAVEMTLIIIFVGVDSVTFRNVGIMGAAFALAMETGEYERVDVEHRQSVTTRASLA